MESGKEYGHSIIQVGDFVVSSEIVTEFFVCDYRVCRGACCVIGDGGAPLEEWEPEEIERNYRFFSPLMQPAGREAVSRSGFFEIDPDGSMVTPLVAPRGAASVPVSGSAARPASDSVSVPVSGSAARPAPDSVSVPASGSAARPASDSVSVPASGSAARPVSVPARPGSAADRECAYCCFDRSGNCLCSIERKWAAGQGSFRKPMSCHLYPIRVTRLPGGMKALNFHRWGICEAAFEKGRRENTRVYQFLEEPIRLYFGSELYEALTQCAQYLL